MVGDLIRMSRGFSLDAEVTPALGTSRRWLRLAFRVLAGVAIVVQSVLVLIYFGMGLGWFGLLYLVNLVQGVVLLALAVLTAVKRPALALAMPVISYGFDVGLLQRRPTPDWRDLLAGPALGRHRAGADTGSLRVA